VRGIAELPTSRDDDITNKILELWRRASTKAKRDLARRLQPEFSQLLQKGQGQ